MVKFKIDRILKKRIDEAQSNKTNEALEKLNSELLDVAQILTEDFELMIDRERNLTGSLN